MGTRTLKTIAIILLVIKTYRTAHLNQIEDRLYEEIESTTREIASACVLAIANEYFPEKSTLIVSLASADKSTSQGSASTETITLDTFFDEIKWSIFINKATQKMGSKKSIHEIETVKVVESTEPGKGGKRRVSESVLFFKKADNYILQVRNVMEFQRNLKQLISLYSWNPHANFLILLNGVVPDVKPFLSYFIQKLWERQVINAVIIIHDPEDVNRMFLYTWFPYAQGHCGDQFNDPSVVGTCFNGAIKVSGDSLFPEKIPNDLNGCPIRTYAYVLQPYIILPTGLNPNQTNIQLKDGVEVLLMELIAARMNFKPMYQISRTNNTLSNLMTQLVRSHTDIAIGAIPPENDRHKLVDFTHPYIDESITWCVPASEETPRWKNFLFSFSPEAWLVIFIAYIMSSIATWLLSRNDPQEPRMYKNLKVLIWLYSVLINMPLQTQPVSGSLRYVILAWILFCFIANVTFQTFLMSALTKPIYEVQMATFEDLVQTGLKYGIIDSHRPFYKKDVKYKDIVDTALTCDDINECLFNVSMKKDLAIALPRSNLKLANHFVDRYGRPLIYPFESDIITYPIEMLMTKGFPLLEKINMNILTIKEIGLIEKWRSDYVRNSAGSGDVSVDDDDADEEEPLGIVQMQVAFLVLGIGTSWASVAFFMELLLAPRFKKTVDVKSF